MSWGRFGELGYDFEPIATLYAIFKMVQSGKTPTSVEFNPPYVGAPDGFVEYAENETHYIQAKTKMAGSGNWTLKNEHIVNAISNFIRIDMRAREQDKIGIHARLHFLLCLEGEPNKDMHSLAEAIKNPSDPKNLEIMRKAALVWLKPEYWMSAVKGQKTTPPTEEEALAALYKTRICYRLEKSHLESILKQALGSHYNSFLLEAKKKTITGSVLDDIVRYLRNSNEAVRIAGQRIQETHLPVAVRNVLISMLTQNEIIDFTVAPWTIDDRQVNLHGTIHTKTKMLGIHYSEEVTAGENSLSYVANAVVPGKREVLLITSSRYTRSERGMHIVDPDSDSLENDIRSCVVNGSE